MRPWDASLFIAARACPASAGGHFDHKHGILLACVSARLAAHRFDGPGRAGHRAAPGRQGGVHRRRAAGRAGVGHRHPAQEPVGSRHADRRAPRKQPARGAALPALRAAPGRVRRLQDAAPGGLGPGRRQAACAGGQPVAPGQGAARGHPARHRGPGLGLPLPGAPVGALRAEEERGADRLSRAQEPLRGRHARMPRAAAACECTVAAAARAHHGSGGARDLPADRAGGGRRDHGAGAAASGAALRR